MEPGPSGQEDWLLSPRSRWGLHSAAMEPGPSGQEDTPRPSRDRRRARGRNGAWPFRPGRPPNAKRRCSCRAGRNGAWPFRPGRLDTATMPKPFYQDAAMEPGPSGQEDPEHRVEPALHGAAPQWSLALQARKTRRFDLTTGGRRLGRNGAWPFRPGRRQSPTRRPCGWSWPQWSLALQARKTARRLSGG